MKKRTRCPECGKCMIIQEDNFHHKSLFCRNRDCRVFHVMIGWNRRDLWEEGWRKEKNLGN